MTLTRSSADPLDKLARANERKFCFRALKFGLFLDNVDPLAIFRSPNWRRASSIFHLHRGREMAEPAKVDVELILLETSVERLQLGFAPCFRLSPSFVSLSTTFYC